VFLIKYNNNFYICKKKKYINHSIKIRYIKYNLINFIFSFKFLYNRNIIYINNTKLNINFEFVIFNFVIKNNQYIYNGT
jgi:hypothetical protein